MKTDTLLERLEELIERLGYTLRKEKGNFSGDHCIVEGDKLVMVNKNRPKQMQVGTYARVLRQIGLEDVYVKPAIRDELEDLWARFDEAESPSSSKENTFSS